MNKITIIGSGFAALTAIKTVRQQQADAEITVICPKAEMIYYPSLIWIPTGKRVGDDLRVDLHRFFQRMNVRHIAASATGIRNHGRTVLTEQGEIHNDGLIIASGGRFMKKLPGIEHSIALCEGIPAAEQIRDRIQALRNTGGKITFGFATNPNEPAAMRGGPMFELMFGLDNWMRQEGIREKFSFSFVSPAAKPGQRLGDKAVDKILTRMQHKNITAHLGHKILGFEEKCVKTEGGDVETDLILFMPGMTGPGWADNCEVELSAGGFFPADAYAKVKGLTHVYVAGDAGSYPGPDWLPKQAHMADLQAQAAVSNLLAELAGNTAKTPFKVELICIVDMHNEAMLVKRTEQKNILFPCRMLHWVKQGFEWWYLRQYRA